MSDLHDMELADTLERLHRKAASPPAAAPQADRTTERWQRIRAALCPFHGLTVSLDEYADLVWSAVSNATAPAAGHRVTLRGRGQEGA